LSVPDVIKSSVPLEVLWEFIFAYEFEFRRALAAVRLSTFLSPALFVEETADPEARVRRNVVDKTGPLTPSPRSWASRAPIAARTASSPARARRLRFAEFCGKRFTLLWGGIRDCLTARDLHSHCDRHANTLIFIEDTAGNIFGEFTPVEWDHVGESEALRDEELPQTRSDSQNVYANPHR
jgi:hypothetical protein